ncbi:MAG: hypothetical protein AAGI01_15475 [Myxococcota bacterium]
MVCLRYILVFVALASSCEGCAGRVLGRVERAARVDPGRPGKVGALVGLQVRHRAVGVVRGVAGAPSTPCSLDLTLGEAWSVEWSLEVWRGAEVEEYWRERIDAVSSKEAWTVRSRAGFKEREGSVAERVTEERYVAGELFTSEGAAVFTRQRVSEDAARARRTRWVSGFDALVAAAGPWTDLEEGQWEHDAASTQSPGCAPPREGEQAWVARAVKRARLTGASLSLLPRTRTMTGRWTRSDGAQVRVAWRERVGARAQGLGLGVPERVEDGRAGREGLFGAVRTLERLRQAGFVDDGVPLEDPGEGK